MRLLRAHGRRLVERLEQRRALDVRRNPVRMVYALNQAHKVLILCQGNVIRSVFAAHLLSAAVRNRTDISILSAGLATKPGWPAHPRVIARGEALGLQLREHTSVAVTSAMLAAADVVLVMDFSQLVAVTRRFFGARRRTFLLTSMAADGPIEIRDPAGQNDAAVDRCLDDVARAIKPIAEWLTARGT